MATPLRIIYLCIYIYIYLFSRMWAEGELQSSIKGVHERLTALTCCEHALCLLFFADYGFSVPAHGCAIVICIFRDEMSWMCGARATRGVVWLQTPTSTYISARFVLALNGLNSCLVFIPWPSMTGMRPTDTNENLRTGCDLPSSKVTQSDNSGTPHEKLEIQLRSVMLVLPQN